METQIDEQWIADQMPRAASLKPGLWTVRRQVEDGVCYVSERMSGSLYVYLQGKIDDQGRKWILMMAGFKERTKARPPTWDETRELKGIFFGDENVPCIIPVLPRNTTLTFAPATINVWRCLDGTPIPNWPDNLFIPPGWTKEEAEALRAQHDAEKAGTEAKAQEETT